MTKTVKHFLTVALSLVCVLSLSTACSNGAAPGASSTANSGEASSTAAPAKTINITYASFTGQMDQDQLGAVAIQYMKENPNVKITYVTMDHDAYQQKITIMCNSDTCPDIFWWNGTNLRDAFMHTKSVLDLTQYYDDAFKAELTSNALNFITTSDGKICGFPAEEMLMGWWYNKAIMTKCGLEIPKTFDDFKHAVTVLKQKGYIPIAFGTKEDWATWGFYQWYNRFGIWDQGKQIWKDGTLKLEDSGLAGYYKDLAQLHELGAFPENCSTIDYNNSLALFTSGKAAIMNMGSDHTGEFVGTPVEKDVVFTWGPSFTDSQFDQHTAIKSVMNAYGIGANAAKDQDKLNAIIAFMKWRYGTESVEDSFKAGYILPVKYNGDITKFNNIVQQLEKGATDDYKPMDMSGIMVSNIYNGDATVATKAWQPIINLTLAEVDGSKTARGNVISAGDTGIMDISLRVGGYWSDCCNTVVFGAQPDAQQRRYFNIVKDSFERTLEILRPGIRCSEIYDAIEEVYRKNGVAAPHYYGHQIGALVNEPPRIFSYDTFHLHTYECG